MEVPHSEKFMLSVLFTEFFGTMFFATAFNMNVGGGVLVPLVLFLIIILTGTVSGGHVNPGVTMAVYIERE